MPPRRNIELKARCRDLDRAAVAAVSLGASRQGELIQIDTYFRVASGRLKLREIEGSGAELIWYERPDHVAFRASDYFVVPVAHPQQMKAALARALGVRGEVRKRRQLLLWHNVRIHLDQVEELGSFIELEAVITDEAEATSHERLATLTRALHIEDADRIAGSYSDLLGI